MNTSSYKCTGVTLSDAQILERIRMRVAEDLEKMRETIGAPLWLGALTEEEFQVISTEILPVILQAINKRT